MKDLSVSAKKSELGHAWTCLEVNDLKLQWPSNPRRIWKRGPGTIWRYCVWEWSWTAHYMSKGIHVSNWWMPFIDFDWIFLTNCTSIIDQGCLKYFQIHLFCKNVMEDNYGTVVQAEHLQLMRLPQIPADIFICGSEKGNVIVLNSHS